MYAKYLFRKGGGSNFLLNAGLFGVMGIISLIFSFFSMLKGYKLGTIY